MHLKKYADNNAFFGFFETVDDYAVAEALLDAATGWLRERGYTGVRGPVNPSMNDTAGLLVEGFDREPTILMPYNPPYYVDFLERYGFERAMTMWAYYVHEAYVNKDKLRRGAEIVMRRNPGLTPPHARREPVLGGRRRRPADLQRGVVRRTGATSR